MKEEIDMKNESMSELIKCLEDKLDDEYGKQGVPKNTFFRQDFGIKYVVVIGQYKTENQKIRSFN